MEQDGRPNTANHIDADVVNAAVQAGSIRGGVHFHLAPPPSPKPPQPDAAPTSWADLPPLPPKIQSLLRAQVQAAHELPYRLPGARRPSLATVYVRQDVSTGTESQPAEPDRSLPILDSRGQQIDPPGPQVARLAVRPPSRTVREALNGDDHLLVTGGPGQGKSTLSLRLAADVAARWSAATADVPPLSEPVVPLRLTARDLAARLDLPFFDALADSVRIEYGALLAFPVEAEMLAERVAGCRWLLLVDGLDEVADPVQRDRLVQVLANWASDPATSHYRVILTTRPIEGAALAPFHRVGAARYELLPFDEEAVRRFAENWFSENDDSAERFVREIRQAHLDELVRVPLLATIAAIMFEQYADQRLPDNRYELYEAYLSYLRTAHPVPPGRFDQSCEGLLEHLGRVRLEEDTSLVGAACTWVTEHLPAACAADGWREELIGYLRAIGPFTASGGDLRFLHHSFAEHLAATAKARLLPDTFSAEHDDFVRLLHAARLSDRGRHARLVLLHHTRLHPAETDRLIRHLHEGNADTQLLAARLLAWHAPVSAEVMAALLATARAWAMTTQHPGREILGQISRATRSPGLGGWLADLMRAEDAPWESRVEAATALATRLHGLERTEAVGTLRAILDDPAIPVESRLDAAEALSESGSGERAAAVAGLRSVLDDPAATGWEHREAAVVLSGLGAGPRGQAIDDLLRQLDDPALPDGDTAEAARGLAEIGVEFHERCAEVFRGILGKRTISVAGKRSAALGLASLGPHQFAEVVATLEAEISDPRGVNSFFAVRTLLDLAPQRRIAVGELVLAAATRPGLDTDARLNLLNSLADFGPEFHDRVLASVREVFADRLATPYNVFWAATTLMGLGPDHHDEAARELARAAGHPLADAYDRGMALGKLAELGEPHRAPAVATLRGLVSDRGAEPGARIEGARELIQLGPEFHAEAARYLTEIATTHRDPEARVRAWRRLWSLGNRHRRQAEAGLLAMMGTEAAEEWETHRKAVNFYTFDTDHEEEAAAALTAILSDPARSGQHRVTAAHSLVQLGRRHHEPAVRGVVSLLRSGLVPDSNLRWCTGGLSEVNAGLRAELADALLTGASASAAHLCAVTTALRALGIADDPGLTAEVRAVLADGTLDGADRVEAAFVLGRTEALPDAIATMVRLHREIHPASWERQLRELIVLGADVVADVRELAADPDTTRRVREASAALLAEIEPSLRHEAVAELRSQAGDELLAFTWRTEAILRLARFDSSTVDDAVVYHRTVLDDERETIASRCEAASQLVRLDQSSAEAAIVVLRRFASSHWLRPEERADAVDLLDRLTSRPDEMTGLWLAIAHDPAASTMARQKVADALTDKDQREVERALLADRAAGVSQRAGHAGHWQDPARAIEAEAMLRDVLQGAETPPAERVEAAAALADLFPGLAGEAVSLLDELSQGRCAGNDARQKLVELDSAWRRRLLAEAGRILRDEALPPRDRVKAAMLLRNSASELSEGDQDQLVNLLSGKRISDRQRFEILCALRRLGDLRVLRDDPRGQTNTRRNAAKVLRDYGPDDREAGFRLLQEIANDPHCRPTLRWRAADDLTAYGSRGREAAVAALRAMTADAKLPVIVRVDASRVLGDARPDLRGEVLRSLRGLRTTGNPLARVQVFESIARYEPTEGALALCAMAEDPLLGPVTRLRAASAVADRHRDYRDVAATVAREVAFDENVPWHVRLDAARGVALLSAPCRTEARQLLTKLLAGPGDRATLGL